jgi:hypothetical protein
LPEFSFQRNSIDKSFVCGLSLALGRGELFQQIGLPVILQQGDNQGMTFRRLFFFFLSTLAPDFAFSLLASLEYEDAQLMGTESI